MKKIVLFFAFFSLMAGFLPAKENIPVKVACVGNSITYGTGIKDREHDSYPAQLQQLLGKKYIVGNFGKPGTTLLNKGHRPYTKQEEFRQALAFAGDIVVIHLGINDTDPRDWPNYRDEFITDYLGLMDSLRSVNPETRFLIARMTPIGNRHPRFISGTKLWHSEIQAAIETVARVSHAELIDFHEPLYAFPQLFPDALHPNEEGAGKMAHTVYSAITGDYGGLQMPMLYTDYMILQRNIPLRIHGTANSQTKVTVKIAGQKQTATADHRGKWEVILKPLSAGNDYELRIETSEKKLVYRHVAVGEVWLCSGQSNMQFMLKQAEGSAKDIETAEDSDFRVFDMKGRWDTNNTAWEASAIDSVNHLLYYRETSWTPVNSSTAADFSAVAYYFGRMLRDSLQVPVGLICNAVGGSPTEAWIDRNSLETQFPAILTDWLHNDFIQDWVRGRAVTNLQQAGIAANRHPYEPCYLYETGIQPLQQYPLKGIVWYQGESNAHNFEAHERLFKILVNSWRNNWKNSEMPFYFVQLSSLNRPSWTWFRDSQRRLMNEIPCTGMAVSSDRGDSLDVHPRQKKDIGMRLARWALYRDYHHTVIPSGPLYKVAYSKDNTVIIKFDYGEGLRTSDGQAPSCFEIAEYDGIFYPARATIEGNCIHLQCPQIKHPRFVRYGWQPFTRANLINQEGLPASTFRDEIRNK